MKMKKRKNHNVLVGLLCIYLISLVLTIKVICSAELLKPWEISSD